MKEIKDWRGTRIEVGDVILYAVRHSTSVEVNQAVVSEVGYRAPAWLAEMRDVRDSDKKPYVVADWILSSYCFRPDWDGDITNFRRNKRVQPAISRVLPLCLSTRSRHLAPNMLRLAGRIANALL